MSTGGAAHVVTVEQHRQFALGAIFDAFDDTVSVERRHDPRGVFERQPVGADLDELLRVFHPLFQCMNRAYRVIDFDVRLAAELLHRLGRCFDIAKVVGRFEYAENIDPIGDGSLDKFVDDRIRVRTVGENVLAAQKHLQLGFGHDRFHPPQPLPRIFVEIAHAHIKRRAAPHFHRVETAIVDGGT